MAHRDRRIAELEAAIKTAAELTLMRLSSLRAVRIACEEEISRLAKGHAIEKRQLEMLETRLGELMGIMDRIEVGVEKIYTSRRWRFANIGRNLRGLFSFGRKIQGKGHPPIDKDLDQYRQWRERYCQGKR